jgi:hypothetical protein
VDKVNTSSADDAPVDDDPDFLEFAVAVPWIGCWTSFLPQKY